MCAFLEYDYVMKSNHAGARVHAYLQDNCPSPARVRNLQLQQRRNEAAIERLGQQVARRDATHQAFVHQSEIQVQELREQNKKLEKQNKVRTREAGHGMVWHVQLQFY